MDLADTLITSVRLALDMPDLDVRILDRSSARVSDSLSISLRVLGWSRIGVDERRHTIETSETADPDRLRETIHGARVLRVQIIVDGTTHALEDSSEAIADRLVAGFSRDDVGELLDAANLASPTCGPVDSANARGDNADTRSIAVFLASFNTSRRVSGGLVEWVASTTRPTFSEP